MKNLKPKILQLIDNLQQMPERYKLILAISFSVSLIIILVILVILVNNILKQKVL